MNSRDLAFLFWSGSVLSAVVGLAIATTRPPRRRMVWLLIPLLVSTVLLQVLITASTPTTGGQLAGVAEAVACLGLEGAAIAGTLLIWVIHAWVRANRPLPTQIEPNHDT